MTTFLLYSAAAFLLIGLGIHGALTRLHLVRLILALNVTSGGVFLFLIAVGYRNHTGSPDPVPQALVLTGIVVAVSVSALGLAIVRQIQRHTGRTTLSDEDLE